MTNLMTYKRYQARVAYDGEDECFIGHLAGIKEVVGFHATSVRALKSAFRDAVDDYIETCKKVGKPPEKPFSGKVMFRIAPQVHADAVLAAQLAGKSLNQWAEEVLRQAAKGSPKM
ncbi:type II toxin-antitoxin system HicB family antitoxin [Taklimakanibacter deserti]|uniref:type II toxin-antitoxin system HicB family antitoxin n=1 Tax=Taklimakanibacter deserti TaxID=2267839 RepID=UPI000E649CEE